MLGGTFNPPHRGHLALASHARAELELDCVLLVPAHLAPFKSAPAREEDPGGGHRLQMCELAALDVPGVSVSAVEIERGGVSYTVDTLRSLHASHLELTLILGADVASTLSRWHDVDQVFELAHVAVAGRPSAGSVAMHERPQAGEAGRAARFVALQMEPIDVSSSMVRHRVARGESIDELVGARVADYIAEQGLYRTRAKAGL